MTWHVESPQTSQTRGIPLQSRTMPSPEALLSLVLALTVTVTLSLILALAQPKATKESTNAAKEVAAAKKKFEKDQILQEDLDEARLTHSSSAYKGQCILASRSPHASLNASL